MSDERMDERLRDYAARWTAARPAPPVPPVEELAGRRPGRSWVPYAAAAAVVTLVAGVALAVSPRDRAKPDAAAQASGSPASEPARPSYAPCGEEDVKTSLTLSRDGATGWVNGTLELRTTGAPCRLPKAPRVDIVGENRRDLGVEYRFQGDDVPFVVQGTRRLALRWSPPLCPRPPQIMVGVVTLTEWIGSKHPLDPAVSPKCHGFQSSRSVLTASWVPRLCSNDDWEVVSAEVTTGPGPGAHAVNTAVVLRNVSEDFCEFNLKAGLDLVAEDGRAVKTSSYMTMDARSDPAVAPGETVRAPSLWRSYCGPELGAYRAFVLLRPDVRLEFDPGRRPVPPCIASNEQRDEEALVQDEWLERVR